MNLEFVAALQDGNRPIAMTNYRGYIYIACDNGNIWRYENIEEGPLLTLIAHHALDKDW